MKMTRTPLTKDRVRHHFHYGWWKYVLVSVGILVGLNLFFTMTRYQAPKEARIDLYLCASGADQEALQAYLDKAHQEILPDMEEINCLVMMTNDGADPYAVMQLSTFIMAGEGTVYMLSAEDFRNYASQGGMVNLDPYIASGALDTGDIDLQKGTVTYREEEGGPSRTHVFGIPADGMFGLWDFNVDNRGMVFCVTVAGRNDDNAVKLLDYMIKTLTMPMPELVPGS